jgi:DNA-binding CsgD family transcriptional regulator
LLTYQLVRADSDRVRLYDATAGQPLTPAELDVLAAVADGLTDDQIAARRVCATNTVKKHLLHLFGKLGARNRAHAGAIAVARHLVEPSDLET